MFICRALTLRWLCGWKLLELQFVAEQITSLHFLDSLNSSQLVGRVMFFRNVTASAYGSTYLICEVTKVDYFKLVKKCLQGPSGANKGSHASSHIKTTNSHNKVVYFFQVQVTNRLKRRKARVQRKMSTFRKHKLRSIRHLPRPHTPSDKKLKLCTLW